MRASKYPSCRSFSSRRLGASVDDGFAVVVSRLEPQPLAQRHGLGIRDAAQRHASNPGARSRFEDKGYIAGAGRGVVARPDRYPGGKESPAGVGGQQMSLRLLQPVRPGIAPEGETGGLNQIDQGENWIPPPDDPPDLEASREMEAQPDAVRLLYLVHPCIREEAEGPEAFQALADRRAREGSIGQPVDGSPYQLCGKFLGGDQVQALHDLGRVAENGGGRGCEEGECGRSREMQDGEPHRNRNRSIRSPPTPPGKVCSPARSSGPIIWYSTRSTRFAVPETLCE